MTRLRTIPGSFAVVRLEADAAVPAWLDVDAVVSITRTDRELSIVCSDEIVPAGLSHEPGLGCLAIDAQLGFDETGVIARLSGCLADAGIPLFVVSTFDTDLVFIRNRYMAAATAVLSRSGYDIPSI